MFFHSFINNQIACVANVSTYNKIIENLGIPEKPPKKPVTGFIRFAQERRDSYKDSSKPLSEVTSLAAAEWRQLSDEQKEKYNVEYKKQYVRFPFTTFVLNQFNVKFLIVIFIRPSIVSAISNTPLS